MQKSKMGLNVGVVGAAAYLLALFGGYIPLLLLAGYVLLFESNGWLKRTALKAVVLTFLFSLASTAIGFIPDVIEMIHSIVAIFDGKFTVKYVAELVRALYNILNVAEVVLLVALAVKAMTESTIIIGFVDKIVNKCVE